MSVKDLYERWPYPEEIQDLGEFAKTAFIDGDPKFDFESVWPGEKRFEPRILSAGCGTYQAALIAYHNPNTTVTGIDISSRSIECTQRLIEQSGLNNCQVHNLSIDQLNELDGEFDLIFCTGVLHHLNDPVEGGKRLLAKLAPGGRAVIMLYGSTLRSGIYPLQEAFRTLGLQPDAQSVAMVRRVLATLPPSHPVQTYIQACEELKYDGAIVDTFLHPTDQAYSVSDIFKFCDNIDADFVGWVDSGFYSMRSCMEFKQYKPINTDNISIRDESIVADALTFARGKHEFVVANRADAALTCDQIDCWGEDILKLKPKMRGPGTIGVDKTKPFGQVVNRKRFTYPGIIPLQEMIPLVNGAKTLRQCLESPIFHRYGVSPDESNNYLKALWRSGHLTFGCA